MEYSIQAIIPYHTLGTFKRDGINYQFNYTYSMSSVGHLYIIGNVGSATTENLYMLSNVMNSSFVPIKEKIIQAYTNIQEYTVNVEHYQVIFTFIDDRLQFAQERSIDVYFTRTVNSVFLSNGTEVVIQENNIRDFLKNINNYSIA